MLVALLPSPFLTPASLDPLPLALADLGHEVTVVDATLARSPKDFGRACAEQLPPAPVLLVAHGDAGPLLPVAAARREHTGVLGAVYLDATLPGRSWESRLALLRRRDPAAAEELARHLYAGGSWPDPHDPAWGGLTVVPRDLAFFSEPVPVPSGGFDTLAWGYLRTSAGHDGDATAARALGRPVLVREHGPFAPRDAAVPLATDLDALAAELVPPPAAAVG